MTPKKPDWFEMTEGDSSSSGIRKVNKKLPLLRYLLQDQSLRLAQSLRAQIPNR